MHHKKERKKKLLNLQTASINFDMIVSNVIKISNNYINSASEEKTLLLQTLLLQTNGNYRFPKLKKKKMNKNYTCSTVR